MDARKILQDLQYRINTTPESDPERGNAIRLRDRLLARLGLSLDDIIIVRTRRKFEKLTADERNMLSQFFRKQFDREPLMSEPHHIGQYYEKGKASPYSRSLELDLTDDEYTHLWPIAQNLLKIYRRELAALQKKIKQEAKARLHSRPMTTSPMKRQASCFRLMRALKNRNPDLASRRLWRLQQPWLILFSQLAT